MKSIFKIADILKMDDRHFSALSLKELREVVGVVRDVVRKRVKRFEKKGYYPDFYKNFKASAEYLTTKGKSYEELSYSLEIGLRVLQNSTSTIRGAAKEYARIKKETGLPFKPYPPTGEEAEEDNAIFEEAFRNSGVEFDDDIPPIDFNELFQVVFNDVEVYDLVMTGDITSAEVAKECSYQISISKTGDFDTAAANAIHNLVEMGREIRATKEGYNGKASGAPSVDDFSIYTDYKNGAFK